MSGRENREEILFWWVGGWWEFALPCLLFSIFQHKQNWREERKLLPLRVVRAVARTNGRWAPVSVARAKRVWRRRRRLLLLIVCCSFSPPSSWAPMKQHTHTHTHTHTHIHTVGWVGGFCGVEWTKSRAEEKEKGVLSASLAIFKPSRLCAAILSRLVRRVLPSLFLALRASVCARTNRG